MVSKKKVVWDELARAALRVAHNHIRQDSVTQADIVKQEIIEASRKLADHPEMHPPDKYRKAGKTRMFASVLLNNIIIEYPTSSPMILSVCFGCDM